MATHPETIQSLSALEVPASVFTKYSEVMSEYCKHFSDADYLWEHAADLAIDLMGEMGWDDHAHADEIHETIAKELYEQPETGEGVIVWV